MQRSARGFTFFRTFCNLSKVMLSWNEECHKSLWHPIVLNVCLTLVKPLPLSRRVNDRNKGKQDQESEMRLMPTKSRVLSKLILYATSQSDLLSFSIERSKLRLASRMFVSR
jgi:hypothetical protein